MKKEREKPAYEVGYADRKSGKPNRADELYKKSDLRTLYTEGYISAGVYPSGKPS